MLRISGETKTRHPGRRAGVHPNQGLIRANGL